MQGVGKGGVLRRAGMSAFSFVFVMNVAVGCSSSTNRAAPSSAPDVAPTTTARGGTETISALTGRWWVPVEVRTGNKTLPVVSPGSSRLPNPYIVFTRKGEKFDANDNCNSYLGSVIITPTTVRMGLAGGTLVGCSDHAKLGTRGPIGTLHQVMVSKVPQRWTINAGRLQLRTANGETVVFRPQSSP